jgi:hypothetical protein
MDWTHIALIVENLLWYEKRFNSAPAGTMPGTKPTSNSDELLSALLPSFCGKKKMRRDNCSGFPALEVNPWAHPDQTSK